MDPIESLRLSWRNIRDHTLRSTLTTLGIIIGVAAVITFVTLGASLQADIVRAVAGENTAIMYVSATSDSQTQLPALGRGGQAVFTQHDVRQLRQIEGVAAVIPESGIATSTVKYGNDSVGRQWVTVTTPSYFDATGRTIVAGGPFTPGEREVVLNRRAAQMFATNVSVGDEIVMIRAVNNEQLNATVVGIVEEPGNSRQSLVPSDGQPMIYAPPNPFYLRTVISPTTENEQRVYARLLVEAETVHQVEPVQGRVLGYLTEQSDARILKPEGYRFEVTTYDQLVDQIKQVSRTFTAYITGIAVISLIVGAIGIANIMLVSVTERTKEIGIMKAVGARRIDILELFLIEAILLGMLGSLVGALVGVAGGYVATVLIDLPFRMRAGWFVVAVIVGVLVGVVAGGYPAWNAAQTDPIDALRHG